MPTVIPVVETDKSDTSELSDVVLRLPSDFSSAERERLALVGLATLELSIREGEAYDVLEELRQQLKKNSVLRLDKQRNYRGTHANTRFQRVFSEARRLKNHWVGEYERVRMALLSLGLPDNDDTFKPLTEADSWRRSTMEPCIGEGMRQDGWIWRVGLGKDSIENEIGDGTIL